MSDLVQVETRTLQEQKHTLRDILVIFFRRRWIVLAVAVPIIIFTFYGTLTTVDTYRASTQVLIEGRSAETPDFSQRGLDQALAMSTAAQVASSIPVATRAATALVDSLDILRKDDIRFQGDVGVDDFKMAILGGIDCSQVADSEILNISFSDANPRFALMVVAAVAEAYVEYSADSKRNEGAIQYYVERVDAVQDEINELVGQKAAVYEEGGVNAFRDNKVAAINNMRGLEAQYMKLRAQRMGLEKSYKTVQAAIEEDPFYIPRMARNANNAMLGAYSNYQEARMELEERKLSYNDSSLFVVRQQEYVDRAAEIFLTVRNGYVRNLREELEYAHTEEQALYEAYNEYQNQIMSYPEIESRLSSLDIEIDARRKLLEALQIKLGEVRMQAESDLRVSNIIQLNVPMLVEGVAGGKKLIYLVLASFLAIALGLVVALFVDINDHRIYSRRQAENLLELPVLGAISEIPDARKS